MAVKTKKAFASFPCTYGFVVQRLLNLKTCLKKRRGDLKKTEIVLIRVHLVYLPLSSGRFGYPYGPGDPFCMRETRGLSERVQWQVCICYLMLTFST